MITANHFRAFIAQLSHHTPKNIHAVHAGHSSSIAVKTIGHVTGIEAKIATLGILTIVTILTIFTIAILQIGSGNSFQQLTKLLKKRLIGIKSLTITHRIPLIRPPDLLFINFHAGIRRINRKNYKYRNYRFLWT